MSLRVRLTLLLTLVVALSLMLAWTFTRRAVRPFTDEVIERHLDTIHFIADEMQKGAEPQELGRRLGFRIRKIDRPPGFVHRIREGFASGRCEQRLHDGLEVYFCVGRRAPVGFFPRCASAARAQRPRGARSMNSRNANSASPSRPSASAASPRE